jgi:lauroyl/myristoyl acyltransferase
MAKYWALRLAAAVAPWLPSWLVAPCARAIGLLMWAIAGDTRRRARANLRHVPTLACAPERLDAATRGVFEHAALNYLDFLRGRHISDQELTANWTIENQDAFEATMAQGRGLIILTGHFGNFEFGASRLGALGYRSISPAEHMKPEELFQLFCRLREHHGLRLVPADSRNSLRDLLEALKRGEIVVFVADRYVIGASVEVPFFGAPAKLPVGPISLALRSGAPVMAVFSWREPHGHSHGVFLPLDLRELCPEGAKESGGGAAAADHAARGRSGQEEHALRQFLAQLERVIADHPEQWVSALNPIWE